MDTETPTGAIDGVNLAFSLIGTPSPVASLLLYRNGLLQKAGEDYTVSGATMTFVSGFAPQPGDILQAWYRTAN